MDKKLHSQLPLPRYFDRKDKGKPIRWILPAFWDEHFITISETEELSLNNVPAIQVNEYRRQIVLPKNVTDEQRDFLCASILYALDTEELKPSADVEKPLNTYYGLINIASKIRDKIPVLQRISASFKLATDYAASVQKALTPWKNKSSLAETMHFARRNGSEMRGLKWHPKCQLLAFANGNNAVIICSAERRFPLRDGLFVLALKHELHDDVLDFFWSPFSKDKIAVCCARGTVIWDIRSGQSEPVAVVKNLGTVALIWTSDILILAADLKGRLTVWDTLGGETENQNFRFSDVSFLKVSPDNSLIAYTTYGGYVGLLQSDSLDFLWESKIGNITSLLWIPNSSGLVFSKKDQPRVSQCSIWKREHDEYRPLLEITEVGYFEHPEKSSIGIVDMNLHPTGSRLAVLIKPAIPILQCCLCATSFDQSGKLLLNTVIGWITLGGTNAPVFVDFIKNTRDSDVGILSLASESGEISHVSVNTNRHNLPETPRLDLAAIQSLPSALSGILQPFSVFANYASWMLSSGVSDNSYLSTLDAEMSMYQPVVVPSNNNSTLTNSTLGTRSAGVSTFVENQAKAPERDRIEHFLLNRSISRESSERSISEPRSDHHMSIDRTPDPAAWKARSRTQSPPSSPASGSSCLNGSYSKLRSTAGDDSLINNVLSIGKLTFAD